MACALQREPRAARRMASHERKERGCIVRPSGRSNMSNETAVVVIVAVLVVAAVVVFLWKQRRTQDLRERFGPEYDRAVGERGGPGNAVAGPLRHGGRDP